MINLVLYKRQSEFLNYLRDLKKEETFLFVTPNKDAADHIRRIFPLATTQTIQSFLKGEFSLLFKPEELEYINSKKLKKSNLLLQLGFIFRVAFPNHDYSLFEKAYSFLSELRSFSLNLDIFEKALEDEDEDLKLIVLYFQKLMMERDDYDEQRGYFELSEKLREGKLAKTYKTDREIIFWGFDFLSSLQVDMLRSLSLRDTLYLGLYEVVFDKSYSVDWPSWFSENELNKIRINSEDLDLHHIKTIRFKKNALAETLKPLCTKFKDKKHSYFLGAKNLSFDFIQEIPESNLLFRASFNILESSFKKLKSELLNEVRNNHDIHSYLEDKNKEGEKEENFRLLKAIELFCDAFSTYEKLLDEHKLSLSVFDIHLLFEIANLDAPKNNYFPLIRGEVKGEIAPIKMISSLKKENISFICASSIYGDLIGGESYSDSLEQKLTAIGPMRRVRYLFNLLTAEINEALSLQNSYLILEHGIEKENLAWSEILAPLNLKEIKEDDRALVKEEALHFSGVDQKTIIGNLSATKLQTYLECPRKYFNKYVKSMSPFFVLKDEIPFNTLGTIEHAVIDRYLSTFDSYEEVKHQNIINEVISEEIIKSELIPSLQEKERTFIEVINFTSFTINFLLKIKEYFHLTFEFEKKIKIENEIFTRIGSIDLLALNQDAVFLLDFKRSSGSVPKLSEIKNFRKIQISFYKKALREIGILDGSKSLFYGYINLSEFDKSLFIANDEDLILNIKNLMPLVKVDLEESKLPNIDSEYDQFEEDIIHKLAQEMSFLPSPVDSLACHFCEINMVCPKRPTYES